MNDFSLNNYHGYGPGLAEDRFWNETQDFFKENPDGAYFKRTGETIWTQYENKNDIAIIDPNSVMFDVLYPVSLVMLIKRGMATALNKLAVREMTKHGTQRIAGELATRGGVLTAKEVDNVIAKGAQFLATKNNANVFVLEQASGKFDVVVTGTYGFINSIKNMSLKSVARLANNYGWVPK
jgi:hypothetical protein